MVRSGILLGALLGVILDASSGAASEAAPEKPQLVVYTYDSFVAKDGAGAVLFSRFEKLCGCTVKAVGVGDAGELLARVQLDSRRKKKSAHVVLGIDQYLWPRIQEWSESWGEWSPKRFKQIPEILQVGKGFLPFDHGVLTLIADRSQLKAGELQSVISFRDLTGSAWKRKLLLQDPRASTPGLALLMLTSDRMGEGAWAYWNALRPSWLALLPSWATAYQMFLKKEAPYVWSYTTSVAYHREQGDADRFAPVFFNEGNPVQIEGAFLVKGAFDTPAEKKLALRFLDFLLEDEAQKIISEENWMLPVIEGISLKSEFQNLPVPPKKLNLVPPSSSQSDELLKKWGRAIR